MKNYFKQQLDFHFSNTSSNFALGLFRFVFFLCLLLLADSIYYFLNFSVLPSTFWSPVGLFSLFESSPFTYTQLGIIYNVWRGCLLLSMLGFKTRFFTVISFVLTYLLISYIHCFEASISLPVPLILISFVFAISKCGDGFSIDNYLKNKKHVLIKSFDYYWPIYLTKIIFISVFCAAGISKLVIIGTDWFMSDYFQVLLLIGNYTHFDTAYDFVFKLKLNRIFAQSPILCQISAGMVLLAEIISPLMIFNKKFARFVVTVLFTMQVGSVFLLFIFPYQSLVTFLAWVPWDNLADFIFKKKIINVTHQEQS